MGLAKAFLPAVFIAYAAMAWAGEARQPRQKPGIYEELAKLLPGIERFGFRGMTCFRADIKEAWPALSHTDTYCGDVSGYSAPRKQLGYYTSLGAISEPTTCPDSFVGSLYVQVVEREFYKPGGKFLPGQRICVRGGEPAACSGPSKNIASTLSVNRQSNRGKLLDFDFRRYKDMYDKQEKLKASAQVQAQLPQNITKHDITRFRRGSETCFSVRTNPPYKPYSAEYCDDGKNGPGLDSVEKQYEVSGKKEKLVVHIVEDGEIHSERHEIGRVQLRLHHTFRSSSYADELERELSSIKLIYGGKNPPKN